MIQVSRKAFLEDRAKTLKQWEKAKEDLGDCVIICDAGDEIICDFCNDLIDAEVIHMLDTGSHVLCESCVLQQ